MTNGNRTHVQNFQVMPESNTHAIELSGFVGLFFTNQQKA
jgi:hypothetical protein